MSAKPSSSSASLKSLKGVFEQPTMQHRRDFLRENKLSLRELQKNTNQKLTQQKEDHEFRQNRYIKKFHKSQEQTAGRRSASQSSNIEQNCKRQSRITAGADAGQPKKGIGRRAYSQQRQKEETTSQHSDGQYKKSLPRSSSNLSAVSKALSCDKEIQTEDIRDQEFLYRALKKCCPEHSDLLKTVDCNPEPAHLQQFESEVKPIHSNEQADHASQCHNEGHNSQHDQLAQHSPEFDNYSIVNCNTHGQEGEKEAGANEDLEQDLRNLKLAADMRRELEQHSSARSRHTLCSNTSSHKGGHKLGGREDVRLPRYLEKEKREKEEERIRELSKDHNCPSDHYALSDEERVKALNKLQQKMASLIKELNYMPMTMETLRIRTRKAEIEKELRKVELDIRLYSKSKVYMPC